MLYMLSTVFKIRFLPFSVACFVPNAITLNVIRRDTNYNLSLILLSSRAKVNYKVQGDDSEIWWQQGIKWLLF